MAPQAVAELGWAAPTAIQAEAVPLALEGRDVLAQARTGSGKTAAYGLPLLERLLRVKAVSGAGGGAGYGGLRGADRGRPQGGVCGVWGGCGGRGAVAHRGLCGASCEVWAQLWGVGY